MKRELDFDTPNDSPSAPMAERRRKPSRQQGHTRPICPFCFQPGHHVSAKQCLNALDAST
jgi:hypothetical protein